MPIDRRPTLGQREGQYEGVTGDEVSKLAVDGGGSGTSMRTSNDDKVEEAERGYRKFHRGAAKRSRLKREHIKRRRKIANL